IGMTDEQSLQAANFSIEARQRHEPLLNGLPRRERIKQQAMTGIGGQDKAAIAIGHESAAMSGGDGQPTFVVQRKVRDASKHCPSDRKSTRLNSSHVAISYAVFCLKKKKT